MSGGGAAVVVEEVLVEEDEVDDEVLVLVLVEEVELVVVGDVVAGITAITPRRSATEDPDVIVRLVEPAGEIAALESKMSTSPPEVRCVVPPPAPGPFEAAHPTPIVQSLLVTVVTLVERLVPVPPLLFDASSDGPFVPV